MKNFGKGNPPHPGEVLLEMYLQPLGLELTEAANRLGVARTTLSRIVNGHSGVSPEMALRLSNALGTSPELWSNLQKAWEMAEAKKSKEWKKVKRFPEMELA